MPKRSAAPFFPLHTSHLTMPMTPAQRHRARVLAAQAAQAAAAHNPHGPMSGGPYELMQAQLHAHALTLRGIQSIQLKIEAKRTMLADYEPYLDGVLQADAGVPDIVLSTVLVWHIDVGNWPRAMQLAEYAMRHSLPLPDKYQRDLPTLLLDEVSEAAIAGKLTGTEALATLARVDLLTDGKDAPDQARAKLAKAIGWAAMGKTATQDVDTKTLQLDAVQIALPQLRRAIALHAQVGVKKDVERLERRLAELLPPQAPN